MSVKKEEIINTAIDLFAELGVKNVSVEKVATKLKIARSVVYYYFKDGKDEIIDHILEMFSNMVMSVKTDAAENNDFTGVNADSILFNLLLAFKDEDAKKGRKISRIIFADHAYDEKIGKYLSEVFFQRREFYLSNLFKSLIESGKVKFFDAKAAARVLNRIFIAYLLEDALLYPYDNNRPPPFVDNLKEDCLLVIKHMLNGSQV